MKKLFLCIAVAGLSVSASAVAKKVAPYLDDTLPLETRVEDALQRMTLDEKIAMVHAQSKFSAPGCPRLGIPETWCSDGPHGVREEVKWDEWEGAAWTNDSCTAMPALTCLAATFDPQLAREYGIAVGEEARYRNKNMLLGPGVNIARTPLCGRNFEYMGEDPYLTSTMVVPYIQGVQSNGVSACVKHYALNNQETDRDHVNVVVDDRALNEIYLPAFRAAVQEGGAWSLMGAYNQYKNQHCCHNDTLLNKILKEQWGFDGVVVSDWGGTHDTREAANNGLDLEMGSWTNGLDWGKSNAYDLYFMGNPLKDLIRSGEIPMSVLDDKVRRLLRLHMRTTMDRNRTFGSFNSPEHLQTARRIANNGIVLLKNDGNLLPIDPTSTIAVIGENATYPMCNGGGSSALKVRQEISPLDGLREQFPQAHILVADGYTSEELVDCKTPEEKAALEQKFDSLRTAALETAAKADMVIFIGGLNKNWQQDTEGGDRVIYGLPFGQEQLIADIAKVNPKMAVVLISGNPIDMPWADQVPAIVQAWYMGSIAGEGLADVLTGKVNPSGHLPFSVAYKLEDYPSMANTPRTYPGIDGTVYYDDGIFVGYRGLLGKNKQPRFPFGHGLSYTTFEYGPLQLDANTYLPSDTITATMQLTNTGKVAGSEVVQFYASQRKPRVARPLRELRAFAKPHLQPGESTLVEVKIPVADLAYYDATQQRWVVDPDTFTIQAAASSADIRSTAPLKVVAKK